MATVTAHTDKQAERPVELLNEIYGPEAGEKIRGRYDALILRHQQRTQLANDHLRSTDSWIISYPDHISGHQATPLKVLDEFVHKRLRPFITGVHILPCFPSSSDEGFSVKDYLTIDERYGTWGDIENLASNGNMMLDAVVNHASTQGIWFEQWQAGTPPFDEFFRTEDPDADLSGVVRARQHPLLTRFETAQGERWVWTTFSKDQADLDYRNPEVALAMAGVLLTYAQHGATAIRLDAVGFLWKEAGTSSIHLENTHLVVQLLRATLDATYPDVLLVSETNVPHAENISYLGSGSTREADMVYQFPLPPLTLHAFATEDATALKTWLGTIDDIPPATTYFNFLASHDGVGLRPLEGLVDESDVKILVDVCVTNGGLVTYRSDDEGAAVAYELNGTWFDLIRGTSVGAEALRRHIASHGLMLALRGEPAIYVQALLAEENAVDLAASTSQPRSMNRRRFTIDDIDRRLADPDSNASVSLGHLVEMLGWRRESDAFFPESDQRILSTSSHIVGIERTARSGTIARVYINVSGEHEELDTGPYSDLRGFNISEISGGVELGPYGIAWMTLTRSATPRES
ncbi:MAG: alpha-amylase family glycosyl hydrolase [Actinomycetia bacterium]|nr:alpha-amylase family glycosyl hydrolase [Actinomycetes bacterium]